MLQLHPNEPGPRSHCEMAEMEGVSCRLCLRSLVVVSIKNVNIEELSYYYRWTLFCCQRGLLNNTVCLPTISGQIASLLNVLWLEHGRRQLISSSKVW